MKEREDDVYNKDKALYPEFSCEASMDFDVEKAKGKQARFRYDCDRRQLLL